MSEKERYSYSRLNAFRQCKYQYYLTYYGKKRGEEDRGEDNAFAQFGTLAHSLLERYEKGELMSYELLPKYEMEYPDAVTYDFPPNAYVDLGESYYTDGAAFFADFDGFDDLEVVGAEDEFEIEIDDFIFCGFIDLELVNRKTDKLIVRDWKSMSSLKKQDIPSKRRQLYSYCPWMKKKFGRFPDRLEFGLFRKQKTVGFDFNIDHYNETIQWIRDTVSEIRSCKEWPATYNEFYCNYLCGHRSPERCGINLF